MGPDLRSLNAYAAAHRRPLRGVPETEGTPCHMCPMMECMPTGMRTRPYRFWCDRRHRVVEPSECECSFVESRSRPVGESFAQWICRRLDEERITRREMSRRLGVSPQTVSKYCNGTLKPRAATLARIEAILGEWEACPG